MSDYRFADYEYESSTGRLYRDGAEVPLAPRAAGLLEYLLARAGEVCAKDELLDEVWDGVNVGEESLTQAMSVLRGALGDDPKHPLFFETIPRRGYRFIGEVESTSPAGAVEADQPAVSPLSVALPWAAAAVAIIAVVALVWPEPEPGADAAFAAAAPIRFSLDIADHPVAASHHRALALSPDGSQLALVGNDRIWLRVLDNEVLNPVPGTEYGGLPFFSPDGRELVFLLDASLMKVRIGGGRPELVTNTRGPRGGDWVGGFFYFGRGSQGIMRHRFGTADIEQVIAVDSNQAARDPQLLPGGEWLLFTLDDGVGRWNDASIVAQHLDSGERRTLAHGTAVRYVASGHLVYARDGGLWAVAFDPVEVATSGEPRRIIDQVVHSATFGGAQFSVADNGTLAYIEGSPESSSERPLKWVAPGGEELVLDSFEAVDNPRLSPDESRVVAVAPANSESAVWLYEIGRNWTLLTTDGHGANPIWSADGTQVYFESFRDGRSGIWRRSIDFSGPAELVWSSDADGVSAPESVSTDGRYLYFTTIRDRNIDTWMLDLQPADGGAASARPVEGLSTSDAREGTAMIHPTAPLLAYVSDESGLLEVYVRELISPAQAGRRWKVSGPEGGDEPKWSRDGSALYYRVADQLVAAHIDATRDFALLGTRVLVDDVVAEPPRARTEYDVATDGRIIIAGPESLDSSLFTRVRVVVDWFAELIETVPAAR